MAKKIGDNLIPKKKLTGAMGTNLAKKVRAKVTTKMTDALNKSKAMAKNNLATTKTNLANIKTGTNNINTDLGTKMKELNTNLKTKFGSDFPTMPTMPTSNTTTKKNKSVSVSGSKTATYKK